MCKTLGMASYIPTVHKEQQEHHELIKVWHRTQETDYTNYTTTDTQAGTALPIRCTYFVERNVDPLSVQTCPVPNCPLRCTECKTPSYHPVRGQCWHLNLALSGLGIRIYPRQRPPKLTRMSLQSHGSSSSSADSAGQLISCQSTLMTASSEAPWHSAHLLCSQINTGCCSQHHEMKTGYMHLDLAQHVGLQQSPASVGRQPTLYVSNNPKNLSILQFFARDCSKNYTTLKHIPLTVQGKDLNRQYLRSILKPDSGSQRVL